MNLRNPALALLTTLILTACSPGIEKALVGSWHASPSLGAGYLERYVFRADGTFTWYAAEGSEGERSSVSGAWKVSGGGLDLEVEQEPRRLEVGPIEAEDPSRSPYPFVAKFGGVSFWKYSEDTDLWKDSPATPLTPEAALQAVRTVLSDGAGLADPEAQERDGKAYWVIQHFDDIADSEGTSHQTTRDWYYVDQGSGEVFRLDVADDKLVAAGG